MRLTAACSDVETLPVEREQMLGHASGMVRGAALQRSEAFLALAQRLSCAGSFSWQVATDEISGSEQLHRIFELEPKGSVTLSLLLSRVHPEDRPLLHELLAGARANGADIDCEHRLLMSDHSVRYVQMVARRLRDDDGQVEYIGAVQDVTRRRIAEEALSNARSELERVARLMSLTALTASIAHEISQPVCAVITNAGTCLRMLSAEVPNVELAREAARRALRDGGRVSEVITRLRALFGKRKAKKESVDLNEATREVIGLCLPGLQRNRIVLHCELAEELPPVIGDRVQLQQVVLNLLNNAAEAMSAIETRSRYLSVKTQLEQTDRVRLSVTDAGVGLEAQVVARLFEPFYTTKEQGMGIGLFVSRSIIENHCGTLQVALNDGPGVTFSFSIPALCRKIAVEPTSRLVAVS